MPSSMPAEALNIHLRRLRWFREQLYGCFLAWPDALFEIMDALLACPGRLESVPCLSLEPRMRRGHGSLYAALARGRIDTAALAEVFTAALDPGDEDLVFALDCSQWPRPQAVTSPARMFNYDAAKNTPGGGPPVTAGWWFSWLARTGRSGDSWATPVDLAHLGPEENHNVVALAQIKALLPRLAQRGITQPPIVCLDGGYSPAYLGQQLRGHHVAIAVRLRADAVLLTDPPPRTPHTTGRPQVHGKHVKLTDPSSWPEPDQVLHIPAGTSHRQPARTITAWHRLHPRHSRVLHEPGNDPHRNTNRAIAHGSLIQIHTHESKDPPLWLWWTGPETSFNLDRIWRAYLRRFDIEHMFRFLKQYLGWTLPRLRTPDQAQRWSWLVAAVYNHLVLGRDLIDDQRLPWERRTLLSPWRVKRGFRLLHPHLDSPANPPKPSRPGPGRPTGRTSTPAPRHNIVKKTKKTPQKKHKTPKQTRKT